MHDLTLTLETKPILLLNLTVYDLHIVLILLNIFLIFQGPAATKIVVENAFYTFNNLLPHFSLRVMFRARAKIPPQTVSQRPAPRGQNWGEEITCLNRHPEWILSTWTSFATPLQIHRRLGARLQHKRNSI